jgi:hypothetical protein
MPGYGMIKVGNSIAGGLPVGSACNAGSDPPFRRRTAFDVLG